MNKPLTALLAFLGVLVLISMFGAWQNDQALNDPMYPGQPSKTVNLKQEYGGGTAILYTKRDYRDHPSCQWQGQPECPTPTPTATATRTSTPTATATRTGTPDPRWTATAVPCDISNPGYGYPDCKKPTAVPTVTLPPSVNATIEAAKVQVTLQAALAGLTTLTPRPTNTVPPTYTPPPLPTNTPLPTPTHEIATLCLGTFHGIKYDLIIGQKIEENMSDGFIRIVCVKDADGGAKAETRLLTKQDLELEQTVEGAKNLLPIVISIPILVIAGGLVLIVLVGAALFVAKEGKELIEVGELLFTFFWPMLVGLIIGVAMIAILAAGKISFSMEWKGIIIGVWIVMIYLILLMVKLGGGGGGHH